jgi:hypothetical protein
VRNVLCDDTLVWKDSVREIVVVCKIIPIQLESAQQLFGISSTKSMRVERHLERRTMARPVPYTDEDLCIVYEVTHSRRRT